ncbi:MAG: 50S ribosomal protein L6 [Spirochaetia bacterium]|nr:50S ribosomal protein L6 [Spirochaetia bacterium]
MSRIGNAQLTIPGGVTLTQGEGVITVKGPLGEVKSPLPQGISLDVDGNVAKVKRTDDSRQQKERHGLTRALLNNSLAGVSTGWKKNIELVGVGYRVQLKGKELVFSLGYSHEIKFPVPEGVKAQVSDQTKLEITGIDKQLVGQVASNIRALRPPEPYKGKGVKYSDEVIRRKAGKTGKAGKGK